MQRQQEQIILQQEDRLRRQQRDFADPGKALPSIIGPDPLPHVQGAEGQPCLKVQEVRVKGATLLSAGSLRALAAPYEGKCLTLADINNLLRDITNAYIERGYVTSRAFVDPSAQGEGVLHVLVVEGTVEKIILNEGDPDSYYRGRSAFPFLEGRPLNLRDIEQGLDQLNRLPSASAGMELVPGEGLGGTIIKVTNQERRTWRASAGFDNSGQTSTGEGMYNLSLEKDNLMGIGDQFAVYWSDAIPFWDEDIKGRKSRGSNSSLSGYWSVPCGYWTFSGSLSRFRYDTKIFGMNTVYTSKGVTNLFNLKADRVLHRDADSKTSFSAAFTNRSVDSFIEGFHLDASSYKLRTLEFSLSHNRRLLEGVAGLSLSYTRGLGAFGATETDSHSHFTPQSEFDKYSATLSFYRPFTLADQRGYWNLLAVGQMTPQTLYGAERIQIGGRSSVRGFKEDSLTGDQGAYMTNEIGLILPWFDALKDKGPVNGVQIYGAYDIGFLHPDSRDRYERGRMQGVAIGLRTIGDLSLEACAAKALDHPGYIKTKDAEFYLSVKYTF